MLNFITCFNKGPLDIFDVRRQRVCVQANGRISLDTPGFILIVGKTEELDQCTMDSNQVKVTP